jgi:7-cyano-7-deazaguanine synthase
MERSIVLLSGGLDSVVGFHLASREGEVVAALTFDYGQRAAHREIETARTLCERVGTKHVVIPLPWLANITQTALVNQEKNLPHLNEADLAVAGPAAFASAKAVWVPNRNGVFINIAAAYAEAWSCDRIVVGFNAEEAATFPDNTDEYVQAVNAALEFSTQNHPKVWAPTQNLDKAGIVNLAKETDAPIELVWPCYQGGDSLCWECESCSRFKRALLSTGNWEWYLGKTTQAAK